jgi:hypothetical protein
MTVTNKAAFSVLTAQEYNDLIALAKPLSAIKPGSQNNATTAFADDTALQVTLAANTTYEFRGWLVANAPAVTDIKFQYSTPAGVSGWWTVKNQTTAGAAETVWQKNALWSANLAMEGSGVDEVYEHFGILTTGAAGGLLKTQFAANAAGTVTMQANSMIKFFAQ